MQKAHCPRCAGYEARVMRRAPDAEFPADVTPCPNFAMSDRFRDWAVGQMQREVGGQISGAGLDRMAIMKAGKSASRASGAATTAPTSTPTPMLASAPTAEPTPPTALISTPTPAPTPASAPVLVTVTEASAPPTTVPESPIRTPVMVAGKAKGHRAPVGFREFRD